MLKEWLNALKDYYQKFSHTLILILYKILSKKNPPQDEINKMAQKWKNYVNNPNFIEPIFTF